MAADLRDLPTMAEFKLNRDACKADPVLSQLDAGTPVALPDGDGSGVVYTPPTAATRVVRVRRDTDGQLMPYPADQVTVTGHAIPQPAHPVDEPESPEEVRAALVEQTAERMEIQADAKKLVQQRQLEAKEEQLGVKPIPQGTLAELLALPDEPPSRIEGLLPWDSSMLLVAMRKTGKTTMCLNLAKALIEGSSFLDRFPVRPVEGRVAILNFEVSAKMLTGWAVDNGIDPDRLVIVNLRGRPNPFIHESRRLDLADYLRSMEVEAVIVDTFGRAYTGTDQNGAGEVTQWLLALDYFTRFEVGAKDLVLTAHAGWEGTRTRGSSGLEDWADAIIHLTKTDDGRRYFKAMGRDVDIEEDELAFDAPTRSMTLTGSGPRKKPPKAKTEEERREEEEARHQARQAAAKAGIIKLLRADPSPKSKSTLFKAVGGERALIFEVIDLMVSEDKTLYEADRKVGHPRFALVPKE